MGYGTFQGRARNGTYMTFRGFGGFEARRGGDSDNYLEFVHDFNLDGWLDVAVVGHPGKETVWYQNPGLGRGYWHRHVAFEHTDNESPAFVELISGQGPVLVCNNEQYFGYAQPDPRTMAYSHLRIMSSVHSFMSGFVSAPPPLTLAISGNPGNLWQFHRISSRGRWFR